jgi:methylated-DNA-[protein]-cysteine S-methyltransferase
VAQQIGKPRSSRAVGAACGANPIPVVIPCHRVIAGNGSIGGFGGGLPMKRRLLQIEGVKI